MVLIRDNDKAQQVCSSVNVVLCYTQLKMDLRDGSKYTVLSNTKQILNM
jgi:hypothetical protein